MCIRDSNFNETSANSISEGVKYRVEVYAERADTGNYELIARFYLTNSPAYDTEVECCDIIVDLGGDDYIPSRIDVIATRY